MSNRRKNASNTAFWSIAGVALAACHHGGDKQTSIVLGQFFKDDEETIGGSEAGRTRQIPKIIGTPRTEGDTESSNGALSFANTAGEANSALTLRIIYTNPEGTTATEVIDQPQPTEQYSEAIRTQYGTFIFSARQNNDGSDSDASISWRYNILPDAEIPSGGLSDRITVRIESETGGHDQRIIEIPLNGRNDVPTLTAGGEASIAEDAEDGTATGYTLTVTDPDIGDSHTFTVTEGTGTSTNFGMQRIGATNVYNLVLLEGHSIDYDNGVTSHALSIVVSDGIATSAAETVTVTITGANDAPELTVGGTAPSIAEDAADTTATGYTLTVTDPDTADSHSFTVMEGGGESTNFEMAQVGTSDVWNLVLSSGHSIDYDEGVTSHTLSITVSDGVATDTVETTVTITDVNDIIPSIEASSDMVSIAEDAADGAIDGITLTVDDRDTVGTYAVTVMEGGSASTNFRAVATSDSKVFNLELLAGHSVNFDSGVTSHELSITVNDGVATSTTPEIVTVDITDANDIAPTLAAMGTANIMSSATAGMATGYSLTLSDDDTVGTHRFTVTEGGSESANFEMEQDGSNSNVWNLVVSSGATLVDMVNHDLSIVVNDEVVDSMAETVTVTVMDVV